MGLFPSANDFKAGKGVEKDAPRKTGVGRFFELVGRDMNGMFLANLLACIGFLPVICLVYIGFLANSLPVMLASAVVGGILAGPALAGMYDTVLRAQKAALAVLSPHISGVQGDAAARDVIREAGYGAYFGHGTGHGVGCFLNVHEGPVGI